MIVRLFLILLLLGFTQLFPQKFPQNDKISVNGIPLDFPMLSIAVMPGDSIRLLTEQAETEVLLSNTDTILQSKGRSVLAWLAPVNPGIYEHAIRTNTFAYILKVIVMKKMDEIKKSSSHFILGNYPSKTYRNMPEYANPEGMIEVTEENQETFLSAHFRLKDFLTRQQSEFPKFVIISPKLIYKLELIIRKLEEKGVKVENMAVLSGYRTPSYNGSIGNGRNSRHVYGDAADIFVDNNNDQRMDDINGDGKINIGDARFLSAIIDEIDKDPRYQWLSGGMGVYKNNGAHSEFVHTDTRGTIIRW